MFSLLARASGGHPVHLEPHRQRLCGDESHQGHLQEGAQPPARDSHRVQGSQRFNQVRKKNHSLFFFGNAFRSYYVTRCLCTIIINTFFFLLFTLVLQLQRPFELQKHRPLHEVGKKKTGKREREKKSGDPRLRTNIDSIGHEVSSSFFLLRMFVYRFSQINDDDGKIRIATTFNTR